MTTLVRQLMHPGVLTCPPETTLGKLAELLYKHHVHSIFVAEPGEPILGIVTDFDLLAGEWLSADKNGLEAMRRMTAGELMSTPVNTIEANVPAKQAAERMRREVIRRLLVTENGKPIGVISVSDFIANIAGKAQLSRETVADVMSDVFLTCRENTPLASAARAMADTGWRSVLVVNARGRPLGLFSGLDLLALCSGDDCNDTVVTEVMHPLLTIDANASLHQAASLMIENHHHRLVVVDPEQPNSIPLGIISSYDIVAEMARPDSVWQASL
jgi:predicted transcriptional regulator